MVVLFRGELSDILTLLMLEKDDFERANSRGICKEYSVPIMGEVGAVEKPSLNLLPEGTSLAADVAHASAR